MSYRQKLMLSVSALIAALAVGGWLLFLMSRDIEPSKTEEAAFGAHQQEPVTSAAIATPMPAIEYQATASPAPKPEDPRPQDHLAEYPHEPGDPSHPMSERRLWLNRENHLIQLANDAMDLGRTAELRRILELYREHDPVDELHMQEGYHIIADCQDHSGPASRAAAQRFIEEHRASTLRRFVRRHCIGDR